MSIINITRVSGMLLVCSLAFLSCTETSMGVENELQSLRLEKYPSVIHVDSSYTYMGDELYNRLLNEYNFKSSVNNGLRSLNPDDESFFNKKMVVKTINPIILYGQSCIYPGSILEGNSINEQKFKPIILPNRRPITVSSSLTHTYAKSTSKVIENPSYSKLNDYVKEMVRDGSFAQSEKFMFHQARFTFFDEIKTALGANVDVRGLFSSRKEQSTELRNRIVKSTGMYVKFYQSAFTVNTDIEPLSDTTVKGSSSYEPVYVNSVTYGRMGILVFETDEDYIFAKKCISKEFSRIFQSGKEKLTREEEQFFNETEFKLLVIGGDSNYTVHSINGYAEFLEMIYKSRFTEEAYGVPISCTFAYANSHEIVELEIENTIYIEPLFVSVDRAESRGYSDDKGLYSSSSSDIYLSFYRDREKTKKAFPKPDIEFRVTRCHTEKHYYPDYNNWPAILIDSDDNEELVCLRNVDYNPMIYVGSDYYQYSQSGPAPLSPMQSIYQYQWEANEKSVSHTFHKSPFFRYV